MKEYTVPSILVESPCVTRQDWNTGLKYFGTKNADIFEETGNDLAGPNIRAINTSVYEVLSEDKVCIVVKALFICWSSIGTLSHCCKC